MTIDVKGEIISDDLTDVYDAIGIGYCNPKAVISQLSDAGGDDVEVDIASPGGDVFAASEIYTELREYPGNVTVHIQGMAASAASVIAMAGDTVEISPTAQIMIHKASTVAMGNADDFSHDSNMLNQTDQSIINAYEQKTGMDRDQLLQMMSNETWITAKQAVDLGFADKIMFAEENAPVVLNSATAPLIPRKVINRVRGLITEVESLKKQQNLKQQENKEEEPTPSLLDQKLAILMGKEVED